MAAPAGASPGPAPSRRLPALGRPRLAPDIRRPATRVPAAGHHVHPPAEGQVDPEAGQGAGPELAQDVTEARLSRAPAGKVRILSGELHLRHLDADALPEEVAQRRGYAHDDMCS